MIDVHQFWQRIKWSDPNLISQPQLASQWIGYRTEDLPVLRPTSSPLIQRRLKENRKGSLSNIKSSHRHRYILSSLHLLFILAEIRHNITSEHVHHSGAVNHTYL